MESYKKVLHSCRIDFLEIKNLIRFILLFFIFCFFYILLVFCHLFLSRFQCRLLGRYHLYWRKVLQLLVLRLEGLDYWTRYCYAQRIPKLLQLELISFFVWFFSGGLCCICKPIPTSMSLERCCDVLSFVVADLSHFFSASLIGQPALPSKISLLQLSYPVYKAVSYTSNPLSNVPTEDQNIWKFNCQIWVFLTILYWFFKSKPLSDAHMTLK